VEELEANPTTWYYLSYSDNALIVASSDGKFNQIMAPKLKPAGTEALVFTPIAGETFDRNQFVMSFRNNYLGGKGEPLVDAPAVQSIDDLAADPALEPAEEDGYGTEEETGKKKKKKSKKKSDEDDLLAPVDEPIADDTMAEPAADAPLEEEKPAKKKKEKEKKEETVDMPVNDGMLAPVEEAPAEEKPAKKKKEKVKKEEPADDMMMQELPLEEEAPSKKKKKSKKDEEQEDYYME
jgi:hypothetical protein